MTNSDLYKDSTITRTDVAGVMAELVESYDPAERGPLTDAEKELLIDFLHGVVDEPLFLSVAGHHFMQNPPPGYTAGLA